MLFEECEVIIASDVSGRNGIGLEVWYHDQQILEIFRDDDKTIQTITTFQKDLPLGLVEKAILAFKAKVPQDYDDV